VDGEMRHVFVDSASFEKLTIPDWLREALAPWATGDSRGGSNPRHAD